MSSKRRSAALGLPRTLGLLRTLGLRLRSQAVAAIKGDDLTLGPHDERARTAIGDRQR